MKTREMTDRIIAKLKLSANNGAKMRGHKMTRFVNVYGDVHRATCKVCGAEVDVDPFPPPNGIDIAGDAVAIGCGDTRHTI